MAAMLGEEDRLEAMEENLCGRRQSSFVLMLFGNTQERTPLQRTTRVSSVSYFLASAFPEEP
jgi:hypothetical protein